MRLPLAFAALIALGACVDTRLPVTDGRIRTEQDFLATVGGKTASNSNTAIAIHKNGTITGVTNGTQIAGNWQWRDGFWCRQIVEPVVSPVDCQVWEVRGHELTITRNRGTGSKLSFVIQHPSY